MSIPEQDIKIASTFSYPYTLDNKLFSQNKCSPAHRVAVVKD